MELIKEINHYTPDKQTKHSTVTFIIINNTTKDQIMDDIESYLASLEGEIEPTTIEQIRTNLPNISTDELKKYLEEVKHAEKYNSNYKLAQQEKIKTWNSIRKTTSQTNVLIYIHNATTEKFTLTHSSWDRSDTPLEDYDLLPADYMAFILPSEPPKRISSAKVSFRSSQITHEFSYKSGDFSFNFSTSLKLHLPYSPFSFETKYSPVRNFSTGSTGKKKLLCLTDLDSHLTTSPYSYAISVNIRN